MAQTKNDWSQYDPEKAKHYKAPPIHNESKIVVKKGKEHIITRTYCDLREGGCINRNCERCMNKECYG